MPMVDAVATGVPLLVGLIFVAWAVLERGYKRYLEEKANQPDLKFGGAYLLNFVITTGVSAVVITTIIPGLIAGLSDVPAEITVTAIILQAILGYTTAYTILSKMNTGTEKKLEIAAAKKKLGKGTTLDHTKDDTKLPGLQK